jgi:hypothetical protein
MVANVFGFYTLFALGFWEIAHIFVMSMKIIPEIFILQCGGYLLKSTHIVVFFLLEK